MTKIERRGDKWTTVIDLPADPVTGKRRRKRITGGNKKQVELDAAKEMQKAAGGLVADDRITVREFCDRWIAAMSANVKPSTLRRYKDLTRLHILPVLGNKKLGKLTPSDIHLLHADRFERGLSGTSVRHVHVLLHQILKAAVDWGIIVRNVTESAPPPRRSTPESLTWNPAEVDHFLAASAELDDEALWTLALFTGMRRGELLGLRWSDVDFDASAVYVRRSLSRGADSKLVEGTPKTAKGRRRISLAPSIVELLRQHKADQNERRLLLGPGYDNNGLVFANEFGRPLHPNTFARRFGLVVARAGVPRIRIHDLRHTNATLMLRQGTHMKIVQERLGHADVGMTMNLYSHVAPDLQDAAAAKLEALIYANREKAS